MVLTCDLIGSVWVDCTSPTCILEIGMDGVTQGTVSTPSWFGMFIDDALI